MTKGLPFDTPVATENTENARFFSPPDMGKKAFADIGAVARSFLDEETYEAYSECVEEIMVHDSFLDECNRAGEIDIVDENDDGDRNDANALNTDAVGQTALPQTVASTSASPPTDTHLEILPPAIPATPNVLQDISLPTIPSTPVSISVDDSVVNSEASGSPANMSQLVVTGNNSKAIGKPSSYDFGDSPKIVPEVIASKIISMAHVIYVKGILYAYTDPVYSVLTPDLIKGLTLKYCYYDLAQTQDNYLINQIYSYCRAKMVLNMTTPEEDPRYVVYKDCRFNLEEGRFEANGPDVIAFSCVNVRISDATDYHPVFDKFLDRITGGDIRLKTLIWEMIGYIPSADMSAKKIFVLMGEGDTGKTILLRVLRALFQQDISECVIPLHSLGERFVLGRLAGIRLVTDGDYAGAPLSEASVATIKSITGGDSVRAEMKGQDAITITPCCKLVISSNYLPVSKINDPAFNKRRLVIPFKYVIPDDEQDKRLLDKIKEELPSIAKTALGYLIRLRENQFKFTQVSLDPIVSSAESRIEELTQRVTTSADKLVQDFVEAYCSFDIHECLTLTQDLFSVFEGFCKDKGQRVLDIKDFSSRLHKLFPNLIKKKIDGKNGFFGISLNR